MITQSLNPNGGKSFFKINEALNDALEQVYVDEESGEVVGLDAVRTLEGDLYGKTCDVARYLQGLNGLIAQMNEAKKSLAERMAALQKKADALNEVVVTGMTVLNAKKIDEADIGLALRKTTAVVIDDEEALPAEAFVEKVTRSVSKTAIKAMLADGKEVQGAHIAENLSLRIK